jgi:hypothetical protein
MPSLIYKLPPQQPKSLAVIIMQALIAGLLLIVFFMVLWNLTLNAIIREADWRADRLCRIYDVCYAERGP